MWSAQRAGTPRGMATTGPDSGMQRFRLQGSNSAVPARRFSSPLVNSKACNQPLMPAVTPAASSSSPAPRRGTVGGPFSGRLSQPSPLKQPPLAGQAKQYLTQKLRAMDLALERNERDDFIIKHSEDAHSEASCSTKENFNSTALMQSWEASHVHSQHSLLNNSGHPDPPGCSNSLMIRPGVIPLRPGSAPPERTVSGSGSIRSSSQGRDEACIALRAELLQELASIREGQEEQQRGNVRLFTEFEVELTAVLEARLKEADGLVEKRLIEAGEGMQRRLTEFEAVVSDDRARYVSLESDAKRRLDDLESAMQREQALVTVNLESEARRRLDELEIVFQRQQARVAEQTQTSADAQQSAKDQLTSCRQRVEQLQEESNDTKDQLTTCRHRVQHLQDEANDTKDQLITCRQRVQHLQDDTNETKDQVTSCRQRVQQLQDESFEYKDQLTSCRQRVQQLQDESNGTKDELTTCRQRVQQLQEESNGSKGELATCRQKVQQLQDEASENKETLVACRQRLPKLEDEVAICRQRIQQLQEDREDAKEQFISFRQRLANLPVEACGNRSHPVEAEWRRVIADLENRLQRVDEGLAERFREWEGRMRTGASEEITTLRQRVQSEARLRADTSEELTSLRQRVQSLLDATAAGNASGVSSNAMGAEAERRLQRLDEALGNRICESEGRLLAQQRTLEGQTSEVRNEFQRLIGDVEHRVLNELRVSETRSDNGRLGKRFDDFQRSFEAELATVRERSRGIETRCLDEVRELLRTGLEEAEAKSRGAAEADIAARFDTLRAELRAEAWLCVADREQHSQSVAFTNMHHQLVQSEEERRVLSEELEALADRQGRQQQLLEDLLSAAARRPSVFGDGLQAPSGGGAAAGPLPAPNSTTTDPMKGRLEALATRISTVEERVGDHAFGASGAIAARLTMVEERLASAARRPGFGEAGNSSATSASAAVELAERCSGRLDNLSARVASVEDLVASRTAVPTDATVAEVQETMRAWPLKLEELASRLENGNKEIRFELGKELREGLRKVKDEGGRQQVEVEALRDGLSRAQEEDGRHRVEVEALRDGFHRAQEEGGRHRAEVEALISHATNSIIAERKVRSQEMEAHVAKYNCVERTAAMAESMAVTAAEEAQSLRQLADNAEQASAAAMERVRSSDAAKSHAWKLVEESESRELAAMVRLEARLEGAEARQILAFSELSERLEDELRFDAQRSSASVQVERAADVELRRPSAYPLAHRTETMSDCIDQHAPWHVPLRNLECHLKTLLAAQAEDSAAAIRSMALMVEESVLRGDMTSLGGISTVMRHGDTTMMQHGDTTML